MTDGTRVRRFFSRNPVRPSKEPKAKPGDPSRPATPPDNTAEGLKLFDLGRLSPQARDDNEAYIRRLCNPIRLEDAVLCRVLGRYKMFVDPHDLGLAPHLMLDGIWEMQVTEAIMGFVRSGMTVVDAGANQGYYTMLLADLVGPQGRVVAAEPNPRMMSLLRRSASINGFRERVVPLASPLSAECGQPVVLQIPAGLPQNASIVWGPGSQPGLPMTTTTLDEQIGDGPIDFVKVDVEGAEEAIWHGMQRIIARQQPLAVFLEFNPDRYADPEGFLRRLTSGGFALARVYDREGVRAASIPEILHEPGGHDRMLVLAR